MQLLKDQVAIVTGAASGIGRSIAELYAANGARVVVSDIDKEGGNQTVEAIRQKEGAAIFVEADVSRAEHCQHLMEKTVAEYGKLTIACNNAGIGGEQAPVGEYPIEAWDQAIAINLSGVFYGMRYQIPQMLEAGGGAIVNITSILGKVGFEGASAYVSAKHGIVGLTKTAALEYAQAGIRVNAVGPGFIDTPLLTDNLTEEQLEQVVALHPIGRLGTAEEVAELVVWLSSPKASFVTGSYHAVDGGYLTR